MSESSWFPPPFYTHSNNYWPYYYACSAGNNIGPWTPQQVPLNSYPVNWQSDPRAHNSFSATQQHPPSLPARAAQIPIPTAAAITVDIPTAVVHPLPSVRTASNLEKHTLAALGRIFSDIEFQKIRPIWLRNPRTGRAYELDFYSDQLKLAVEVQGLQHYVYPNSWHKSRTEWEEQVQRDRLKENLCLQAGVILIHVPFTVSAAAVDNFIKGEVQRAAQQTPALMSVALSNYRKRFANTLQQSESTTGIGSVQEETIEFHEQTHANRSRHLHDELSAGLK